MDDPSQRLDKIVAQNEELKLSEKTQKAIAEILPSKDPLDQPDFNYIDYVNSIFPNEKSVENIENELTRLRLKVKRIDEDILSSVYKQTRAGTKGKQELDKANVAVQELFTKVGEIKRKASESEQMVQEICRDIRDLDFAKRNLSTAIDALRKLHEAVTCVEQIKTMTERKQYVEVAKRYSTVQEILSFFSAYKDIPKIKEIQKQVDVVTNQLRELMFSEFNNPNLKHLTASEQQLLLDASSVVSALGSETKKEVLSKFAQKQMDNYLREFKDGTEQGKLENLEKRYTWLMQLLKQYSDHYSKIFPAAWKVDEYLCEEFCFTTRDRMSELLEKNKFALSNNKEMIPVFTKAIKNTQKFERELMNMFTSSVELKQFEEEGGQNLQDKYEKWKQSQEKGEAGDAPPPTKPAEGLKFKGIILCAFTPYLYIWVQHQDSLLQSMFDQVLSDEKWTVDEDERIKVLVSSSDIFYNLNQLYTKSFSKGQSHFDLYRLFKKYLDMYADKLRDKVQGFNTATISADEEKIICLVLNTSDYCIGFTKKVEQNFKEDIEAAFKEKVEFDTTAERFQSLIGLASATLVKVIGDVIEPALESLVQTNWESLASVGDQSGYMDEIQSIIKEKAPWYRKWMTSGQHFQFWCDSFVGLFIPKLHEAIFKCRRIGEIGAEQLRVDVAMATTFLASMPVYGMAPTNQAPERYVKRVKRDMGRLDKLLKTVMTPAELLVDTFKALVPDHTEMELIKVMDIQGIKKTEQEAYLDQYGSPKDSPGRLEVRAAAASEDKASTIRKLFSLDTYRLDRNN